MRNKSRLKVGNVEPEIKFSFKKDVNHNKDLILCKGKNYLY